MYKTSYKHIYILALRHNSVLYLFTKYINCIFIGRDVIKNILYTIYVKYICMVWCFNVYNVGGKGYLSIDNKKYKGLLNKFMYNSFK